MRLSDAGGRFLSHAERETAQGSPQPPELADALFIAVQSPDRLFELRIARLSQCNFERWVRFRPPEKFFQYRRHAIHSDFIDILS